MVLREWAKITFFDVFTWRFTSLMMVWLKAVQHTKFTIFSINDIYSYMSWLFSSLLTNLNQTPESMHAFFSVSPPWLSPSFWFSEVCSPSHLEDLWLARLLCWWLLNMLLIRSWTMMRLLALPLWPDTHTLCCPCLELSCSLSSLRS